MPEDLSFPGPRTFYSDNWAGIHPEILDAIAEANNGRHTAAYGTDPWTVEADRLFVEHFGPGTEAFLVFNGTGANVVGLQSLLRPFEAVICADSAHINVDECGAPERFLGSKLVVVPTPDGKLTPSLVEGAIVGVGVEHHVQPRVVSITQATEFGTVYTVEEIVGLAEFVHSRGLLLHLDGARLANAAAALGVDFGVFGQSAGVDVLSFGATKNGALGAEAVITFRPEDETKLRFLRKQAMQLASKMRFVAAQWIALMTDDLWLRNAIHANAMARRLGDAMKGIDGVSLPYPVQANAVFAVLPIAATEELQSDYPFSLWDEKTALVRLMASFDTTEEDVDAFVAKLTEVMNRLG